MGEKHFNCSFFLFIADESGTYYCCKEWLPVVLFDSPCPLQEVRCQLVDQLKVMDVQLEQKSQHLHDFADYLRRRSEIESEYSRSLDKLAERFTNRIKR